MVWKANTYLRSLLADLVDYDGFGALLLFAAPIVVSIAIAITVAVALFALPALLLLVVIVAPGLEFAALSPECDAMGILFTILTPTRPVVRFTQEFKPGSTLHCGRSLGLYIYARVILFYFGIKFRVGEPITERYSRTPILSA